MTTNGVKSAGEARPEAFAGQEVADMGVAIPGCGISGIALVVRGDRGRAIPDATQQRAPVR